MYATMTVENLPVSTPRISRDRRAHESGFNYLLTGICALIGATAIAVAAAGTALAVSNNALWVANGTNVVEFGNIPDGTHDEKPKLILNSAVFGAPQAWSSMQ